MNINAIKNKISDLSLQAQRNIVRSALDVIPGTTFVTEKKAQQRLEHCETCPNLCETTRKCTLCGCFVDEKTRVKKIPLMKPEECPEKLW